jgi:hypothetical protein
MSLKDDIFAAPDLKPEPLDIPEWGKRVWVRSMTGEQREEFEDALDKHRNKDGELIRKGIYRAMLAVFVVCDEAGNLVFAEADAIVLARKGVKPLMRVQAKANQLNALTADDVKALEKNSASTPESNSGSN